MPKSRKIREAVVQKRTAGSKSDLDVGRMIRKARQAANVSREELALRLDTKRTAISRIENHAEDIKLSTLERMARALGRELKVRIV